jgi:hypothetical protein
MIKSQHKTNKYPTSFLRVIFFVLKKIECSILNFYFILKKIICKGEIEYLLILCCGCIIPHFLITKFRSFLSIKTFEKMSIIKKASKNAYFSKNRKIDFS